MFLLLLFSLYSCNQVICFATNLKIRAKIFFAKKGKKNTDGVCENGDTPFFG